MPDISKIVSDLKSDKAALVLGPEIFDVDGVPLQRYVRSNIEKNYSQQIASFYERDGLFIFKNQDDKPEIAEAVAELYRDLTPDEELFRKIIEIPFSIVLSVNPDTYLSDVAYRLGVPHRFSAFYPNLPEDIEPPTKELPLIYNVTGCINREASLILDYDDLLQLLEGMVSAPKLPERLRNALGDTKSFVFLGFQFDRWHTQLLLRLLNMRQAVRRIATPTSAKSPDNDTQAFLLNQFKIKFLGTGLSLLDKLHQACAAENMLRETSLPESAEQGDIIYFVSKGQLDTALEKLTIATKDTSLADNAALLSGQHKVLLQEKPYLDSRDFFPRLNKIADSILNIAKQLPGS